MLKKGLSSPNAWCHSIIYESGFVTLNLKTSFLDGLTEKVLNDIAIICYFFSQCYPLARRMIELIDNSVSSDYTSPGGL